MSDLIDRQAAIDAVEESRRLNHHQDGKAACAHEYEHRHFLKLLRDLPPAQPKQRWIPCSERLPEYGKTVLWCNDKGSIFTTAITYMNGDSWAVGKRHRRCQVVAWMPLPEPYGGDQNG